MDWALVIWAFDPIHRAHYALDREHDALSTHHHALYSFFSAPIVCMVRHDFHTNFPVANCLFA